MALAIGVNGSMHSGDADGDRLIRALRDALGMTAQFSFGMLPCGACTGHIDGVATRSWTATSLAATGRDG